MKGNSSNEGMAILGFLIVLIIAYGVGGTGAMIILGLIILAVVGFFSLLSH